MDWFYWEQQERETGMIGLVAVGQTGRPTGGTAGGRRKRRIATFDSVSTRFSRLSSSAISRRVRLERVVGLSHHWTDCPTSSITAKISNETPGRLSTLVHVRPCSSTLVHIRPRSSTFIHIRPRLSTPDHVCPRPSTFIHTCPRSSTFVHARPCSDTFLHLAPPAAHFPPSGLGAAAHQISLTCLCLLSCIIPDFPQWSRRWWRGNRGQEDRRDARVDFTAGSNVRSAANCSSLGPP